jgi:urease accessory protein
MQRPAKPSTPVRFRLPPPLPTSSQDPTQKNAGPTLQASDPLRPYGGVWRAKLSFSVSLKPFGDGTRSVLSNSEHFGPLRLQKPLWPEGRHPVHLLLLHPPGGVAGGDQLHLQARFESGSHCLLTTPGAGKFYKADLASHFHASFDVDEAGLEWLPQETILQDGAQAHSDWEFRLSRGARVIASEILVLGRKDFGETFSRGEFKQSISIYREGRLVFNDTSLWRPELLHQTVSMSQHHVSALFWAARPVAWHEDEVAVLESRLDEITLKSGTFCGVSQVVPGLLLLRVIGSTVEDVRLITHQAWAHLRPQVFERQASLPRIWNT